jgi:hypothetical protein
MLPGHLKMASAQVLGLASEMGSAKASALVLGWELESGEIPK